MSVNQKVEEAKAKLEQKEGEKRDNKGKYRKNTIVERCGFWTISWVILWSAIAGGTWTYAIDHRNELIGTKTIVIEIVHAETTNGTKTAENTAERKIESLKGEFTAYNSEVGQTDADPLIMASNKKVYAGAIACPSKYAFGTKIKVAGQIYTCRDRMAQRFRDGEYFDIWMESETAADNWGRQKLEYEIIK